MAKYIEILIEEKEKELAILKKKLCEEEIIKKKLLVEYADKKPKLFYQLDYCEGEQVIFCSLTTDLRNTCFPVRVQIHESAEKAYVLEGLKQAIQCVESSFDDFFEEIDLNSDKYSDLHPVFPEIPF